MFGAGLIFWCISFTYLFPVLRQRLVELWPTWFRRQGNPHDPNLLAGRWIAFPVKTKAPTNPGHPSVEVVPSNRRWSRQGAP